MRIAMFHPQLGNFGGGEILCLTLAEFLARKHEVHILHTSDVGKTRLENFFNINLTRVDLVQIPDYKHLPKTLRPWFVVRHSFTGYDWVIDTGTNGWFYRKPGVKSACYVHFPQFYGKKRGLKALLNIFVIDPKKAFKYDKILCNSNFTRFELNSYGIDAHVVYPPVEVEIETQKKNNWIISVGRFSYEKKHEVMIEAFNRLKIPGWQLHLVGSYINNYGKPYFEKIKAMAGKDIVMHVNVPHDDVLRLLSQSRIYWHARGFGERDLTEYENFGITTVEAMAAGCIPIVINLGAQPEIVEHEISGYCWNTVEDLISYTKKAIKDPKKIKEHAIKQSKKFCKAAFFSGVSSSLDL